MKTAKSVSIRYSVMLFYCNASVQTYLAASKRCGLSDAASGYWSLHIKEDERHGKQMLDEVALPLVNM